MFPSIADVEVLCVNVNEMARVDTLRMVAEALFQLGIRRFACGNSDCVRCTLVE